MLSPADMLIIGAVALIAFGPDQLPKVARRAGQVMRDVQITSQGFIREMERAGDDADLAHETPAHVPDSPMYGRMAEPTAAPEPYAHDAFADVPLEPATYDAVPAHAPRRRYSASESGRSEFAREDPPA